MFSHIIPKTYLKAWKIPENKESIFIFSKEEPLSNGSKKNLNKLRNTGFGKQNYYYLTIDKCTSPTYDFMFDDLLNKLNETYNFIYKNKLIKDGAMFRLCFYLHKDDIEVIRKIDNHKTTIDKIHNDTNRIWNDEKKHFIEEFFSQKIENDWNTIVGEITKKVENNTITTLNNEYKNTLKLLIVLLLFRNHNYIRTFHPKLMELDEKELIELTNDNIVEFIIQYNQKRFNKNNIISAGYINMNENKFHFEFLLSKQCNFITSDNPVIFNKDFILFPISPKICLKLYTYKENKISSKNIKEKETKKINNICINNSYKNFAYSQESISHLI